MTEAENFKRNAKRLIAVEKAQEAIYSQNLQERTAARAPIENLANQHGISVDFEDLEQTNRFYSTVYTLAKDNAVGQFRDKRDEILSDASLEAKLAKNAEALPPIEAHGDTTHNDTVATHKNYAELSAIMAGVQKDEIPYQEVANRVMPIAEADVDEKLSPTNPDNQYVTDEARTMLKEAVKYSIATQQAAGMRILGKQLRAAKDAFEGRFATESDKAKYAAKNIKLYADRGDNETLEAIHKISEIAE